MLYNCGDGPTTYVPQPAVIIGSSETFAVTVVQYSNSDTKLAAFLFYLEEVS